MYIGTFDYAEDAAKAWCAKTRNKALIRRRRVSLYRPHACNNEVVWVLYRLPRRPPAGARRRVRDAAARIIGRKQVNFPREEDLGETKGAGC